MMLKPATIVKRQAEEQVAMEGVEDCPSEEDRFKTESGVPDWYSN